MSNIYIEELINMQISCMTLAVYLSALSSLAFLLWPTHLRANWSLLLHLVQKLTSLL